MVEGARLLVLGKQGAGKGTQCERLARRFSIPHISSGDVLRAAVRAGSDVGRVAQRFMIKGDLVPDALVLAAVGARLAEPDVSDRGFVLDGFPRTRAQARSLTELLGPLAIDAAIDIDVPTHEVATRLAARRVCTSCGAIGLAPAGEAVVRCRRCGHDAIQRDDDTEQAISRRLDLYEQQTRPLLDALAGRGLLVTIDGLGTPDEVERRILTAIEPLTTRMAEAG